MQRCPALTRSIIFSWSGTVFNGILWKCIFGVSIGFLAALLDYFGYIDSGECCILARMCRLAPSSRRLELSIE